MSPWKTLLGTTTDDTKERKETKNTHLSFIHKGYCESFCTECIREPWKGHYYYLSTKVYFPLNIEVTTSIKWGANKILFQGQIYNISEAFCRKNENKSDLCDELLKGIKYNNI